MRHHTKDKGDMGVGFIIADLLKNGIQVATLLSEHLPFDLIAISKKDLTLCRLSVKYRNAENDVIKVQLRGSWADKHGTHIKKVDKSEFDATAIYCPQSDECYYIRNNEVTETITLRLVGAMSTNQFKTRMAFEYKNPKRLFGDLENPFFSPRSSVKRASDF